MTVRAMAIHKRANLYIYTFHDETTVVIPGATHGLGTSWVGVLVWDDGYPTSERIEPGHIYRDIPTHDITLTFDPAKSGFVLLWG